MASALAAQTTDGLAHGLANAWSVGTLDQFLDPSDSTAGLTADEVRRYVSRYITDQSKVVSLIMSNETLTEAMDTLVEAIGRWRTQ